ncbi:transglutaminase-like cysteine peptidase [Shewanella surugensis]|uniref:Transglutaminase-like cysteine peptidase n=1 Tax=Shewanella surugensis TaxID=212020 RepID=A0ABT0LJ94_9GAMM|nr:transglutaminase-like cysteine peptidase [Shewanella surugensis]MCL1127435.1 transglutaminase-like cysteine peptidase [Shewanella surugensis]
MKISKTITFMLLLLLLGINSYAKVKQLNVPKITQALAAHYGPNAKQRVILWFRLLDQARGLDEKGKLLKVNVFFNKYSYIPDMKLWGHHNYWASPMEFIGVGAGDCEDFSIAKYFTLLQLGVAEDKLRIAMVRAPKLSQNHMVLTYYEQPSSVPFVLDNLDLDVKRASQRPDLIPVYSFNGRQLWLNKKKAQGVLAGSSNQLTLWNDLQDRLGVDKLNIPILNLESL